MLKRRERDEESAAEDMETRATCSDVSTDSSAEECDATKDSARVKAEGFVSRKKVMILACRGVNAKHRHFMDDICSLLPTMRRESKFDDKKDYSSLVELADLHAASHVVLFEPRKPADLFMWIVASPTGPSMRFQVCNIHTLDELALPGNCMRGARPILTFDPKIASMGEHGQAMQQLLGSVFSAPIKHRKVRPYVDRVMHFSLLDGHIWVRNYQIVPSNNANESTVVAGIQPVEGMTFAEIGPRMVLMPVRLLEGAFKGRTLWTNPDFVPRSAIHAAARATEAAKRLRRTADKDNSTIRHAEMSLPRDELSDIFN